MNKEQIKTLLKAVKTDLELFKLTGEGHYFDRGQNGLDRLKKVMDEINKIILDAKREIMLWS